MCPKPPLNLPPHLLVKLMTHKPARSYALRGYATVALIAFTATLPTGCGALNSFRSKLPKVPDLPSAPGLNLSPENVAMMKAMGPVAIVAIGLVADAIAKNMAEQRAAEAAEDERQRVKMAAAELFYADACTQGSGGEKAAKATGEVAQAESKAEAAFAAGDFAAAAESLRAAREAQTKLTSENSPEVARL